MYYCVAVLNSFIEVTSGYMFNTFIHSTRHTISSRLLTAMVGIKDGGASAKPQIKLFHQLFNLIVEYP